MDSTASYNLFGNDYPSFQSALDLLNHCRQHGRVPVRSILDTQLDRLDLNMQCWSLFNSVKDTLIRRRDFVRIYANVHVCEPLHAHAALTQADVIAIYSGDFGRVVFRYGRLDELGIFQGQYIRTMTLDPSSLYKLLQDITWDSWRKFLRLRRHMLLECRKACVLYAKSLYDQGYLNTPDFELNLSQ